MHPCSCWWICQSRWRLCLTVNRILLHIIYRELYIVQSCKKPLYCCSSVQCLTKIGVMIVECRLEFHCDGVLKLKFDIWSSCSHCVSYSSTFLSFMHQFVASDCTFVGWEWKMKDKAVSHLWVQPVSMFPFLQSVNGRSNNHGYLHICWHLAV